jgi:hypothetical protein
MEESEEIREKGKGREDRREKEENEKIEFLRFRRMSERRRKGENIIKDIILKSYSSRDTFIW